MAGAEQPFTVERHDRVESTQSLARAAVESGRASTAPLVIVAAEQTRGVGRLGRPWHSPRGGLWFTVAIPLGAPPPEDLGLRIGAACAEAVRAVLRESGSDAASVVLKHPNDVLLGGKKVLGVLTEIVRIDGRVFALVGVGLNANFGAAEVLGELRHVATTLRDHAGRSFDLEELLKVLAPVVIAAARSCAAL